MEASQFAPIAPSYEGPNPLRPYYRPPSLSERAAEYTPNLTGSAIPASPTRNLQSFGSSARDILSDLNYSDVLGDAAPSTAASVKALFDQAIWRYSSIFMAQPFEVAKLVLQCRVAGKPSYGGSRDRERQRVPKPLSRRSLQDRERQRYTSEEEPGTEDDDDDDEPSYFTSATPSSVPETPSGRSRSRASRASRSSANGASRSLYTSYKLDLKKSHSILEVLAQLWQREGAWGIWKGTNVTFLYNLLSKTVETWIRGMLSAVLNLPDPGFADASTSSVGGLDILDSPSPLASLGLVVISAGVAGVLLAPLDIVRTRLMLTSSSSQPRSILSCLRNLRTWLCPSSLIAPTIILSTLPTLISSSTPLLLRSNLGIDPLITPTSYSICTFLSSVVDLFATLPFETVLRRGQIHFAAQSEAKAQDRDRSRSRALHRERDDNDDLALLPTVVDVGQFNGVVGTIWRITAEEGETYQQTAATTRGAPGTAAHRPVYASRKGQGVQGLWRGWRVGMWGLVGVWGAAALGAGNTKGGEF